MSAKKMLILGFDGFDPALCEKYIAEGLLPNLKKLADSGTFARVGTSNPPQSPVAWSCLISGTNPGHHDVFDFIVRDPSTYLPEIGMTQKKKATGMKELFAGLTGVAVETRRKGASFWDLLGKNKIKSVILRMPVTFPAQALEGRLLSGMGTPDIRGTQGMFSYFTTGKKDPESRGRIIPVQWEGNAIASELTGPRVQGVTGSKDVTVPVKIEKLGGGKVRVVIDDTTHDLSVGEWTPWVRVTFKPGLMNEIRGICRAQLKAIEPEFGLYVTAVNIDPETPAMQISYPTEYAKEIFEKIGNYYTQGMPYDTWAMTEGKLSEEKFLEQAYSILGENVGMMKMELDRFDRGVMFCYFGISDLVSHMFWRYTDPGHPVKGTSTNPSVMNAIRDVYKRLDEIVGEAVQKAGADTAVLVLSDHGFGSYRRSVHVNSWLRENGFLVLKDDETVGKDFFQNVDWSNTRAYSVGFGGIYVNQLGREKNGIVYKGAETEQVKREIAQGLEKLKDNGASVVKKVYSSADLYRGPYAENGPDLFVGFDRYYRASWQSGLGAAPEKVIEDNDRLWGGDHLCDPSLVPGVLFSNLRLRADRSTLLDIAPTILQYFGVALPAGLEGKPLN